MSIFTLRFAPESIPYWASRYKYSNENVIENEVAPRARHAGFLTKSDFLAMTKWKSPRSYPLCARNEEEFVQEVTRNALSSNNDEFRIKSLTLLLGVGWPTASVILHFVHSDPYPILDFRALESLSVDMTHTYDYSFWRAYTKYTRILAKDTGSTMRVLDRALWQFSKEHPPS